MRTGCSVQTTDWAPFINDLTRKGGGKRVISCVTAYLKYGKMRKSHHKGKKKSKKKSKKKKSRSVIYERRPGLPTFTSVIPAITCVSWRSIPKPITIPRQQRSEASVIAFPHNKVKKLTVRCFRKASFLIGGNTLDDSSHRPTGLNMATAI